MVRIFAHANYDFIGFRGKAIRATIALFVVGMIALIVRGVNYSVEFTGGTLMRITVTGPNAAPGALRGGLAAGRARRRGNHALRPEPVPDPRP